MAKRKATRRPKPARHAKNRRPAARRPLARARKLSRRARKTAKPANKKAPRLARARRTLEDVVPTPPSSLDMKRRGTAARSGRAGLADRLEEQRNMEPDIAGGDVDIDLQNAYFTGHDVPGRHNPTPDQEVVDDHGQARGGPYEGNEELEAGD